MAALLLVASAHMGACAQVKTGRDEVVVLIEDRARNLDPRFAASGYDSKLSRLVAPGLTSVDALDSVPRPLLAESVEREGPGRYKIVLRRDARFADGTPVTAEDVAYTYTSVVDPALHATFAKSFADKGFGPSAVEVVDGRTVRFRMPRPLATFESDIEFGIVEKRAALAAGQGGRFPGGSAAGAGPLRVVRMDPDRVELAPNPYWMDGPPTYRRLVFKTVRDDGARILALVGGSADLLQNTAAPSPLLLDTVLQNQELRGQRGRSATWTYLGINCDDPVLRDARVRRAVAMAIDRAGLVAAKLRGRAVLSTSSLPPSNWAYAPPVRPIVYDPAGARGLLEEAGALGAHITIKVSAASKFRLAIARVIAGQLSAAGFDAEVRAYEFATFLGDVKRGNFQLFMLQMPEVTEPDFLYALFHSSRIPTRDNPDAGANRFRYRDPELDALVEHGQRVEDRAQRKAIYAQAQQRLAETLPAVPLWHEDNYAVMRRELTGYELWPNARFSALARVWKVR